MKVLQVLPRLDSGGVERGTLDFARALTTAGHESLVMSAGGRLQERLQEQGSVHLKFPVHAKSPTSLLHIGALRRLLLSLSPDVIHLRSRVPAWMVWLALRPLPPDQRPLLVSTFHGLYSVSRYSAIMGCGDRVIAISDCVRDYILRHYPRIEPQRIRVIPRGVDTSEFRSTAPCACTTGGIRDQWQRDFETEHPQTRGKKLLLMPGRLSPWKGQHEFIDLIADLKREGENCHGVIAGEPTPGKEHYLKALQQQVRAQGLEHQVTFLGHRNDMRALYAHAAAVLSLSRKAEPFGRTVIEALAVGVPAVAWNRGGPAESLRLAFPRGLVEADNRLQLAACVRGILAAPPLPLTLPPQFTLAAQAAATLDVYAEGLAQRRQQA
ncbi:glycosyltransferase family 4 protein [Parahaliea aestuarii]|uniref:Glycosyltransferase family 4 protein n=1 Tax=Parahaliea aestuarii TaxID=1852021 RepID=A0A5C8ZXR7_9GAMM|nr:glycosyltransferase family 4 protein [Parahaliea aestuarii]TXS92629.1 glycosyltransferase family 4 protein [Parahaliea aestuarii]